MVVPFLLLFLERDRQIDSLTGGRLVSAYGIGGICGGIFAGRLIRRFGPRRVLIGALVGTAASFVFVERLHTVLELAAGLAVCGFFAEAFRPPMTTMVGAATSPENRAQSFGLLRMAINMGVTAGSAVGGLLARYAGYSWLFWVDAATCLLAGCAVFALVPAGASWVLNSMRRPAGLPAGSTGEVSDEPGGSPWRDPIFLGFLVCIAAVSMLFLQLLGTVPLYWGRCGLSEDQIGYLFAVNPILIVLVEMPLLRVLRNRAPLPVIAWGCVAIAVGFAVLSWSQAFGSHGVVWVGLVAMIAWTVGEMLESALNTAFVSQRADRGDRGSYMGLQSATFSLAMVLAPILGTWMLATFGPAVLWWSCAGTGVATALAVLLLQRRVYAES